MLRFSCGDLERCRSHNLRLVVEFETLYFRVYSGVLQRQIQLFLSMGGHLINFVSALKSKFKDDKSKKEVYIKMDRTESMKVDAKSRRAQRLIHKTLRYADKPGRKSLK